MKFDGASWVNVGGTIGTPTVTTEALSISLFPGVPYIAYLRFEQPVARPIPEWDSLG